MREKSAAMIVGVFAAVGAIVAVPAATKGQATANTRAPANACASIRGLRIRDVRLTEVVDAPDSGRHGDNVRTPHCRVSGVIGKSIAFTVMLPNEWNMRLLMGGNGGYAGVINTGVLSWATRGYVTVSTNTGHEESPAGGARWALNDAERQREFGYLAVHRTVEVAKALTTAFYGMAPRYSYFSGCSNGGRQGLMEAERYPDDFDGIVAGAPAAHFSKTGASFLKNLRAVFPDPSYFEHPVITRANLDLLSAKVLATCDELDGVKDGILDDPRDCKFKVSSIKACPNDRAASDCLTRAQRNAIERVYAPATDAKGRVIYPGQTFGGENLPGGWLPWITGTDTSIMREVQLPSVQAMFVVEGAKYFLFSDSTWDYTRYPGTLIEDADRFKTMLDADNPDLRRFAASNGKLILWHGWSDPALNPLATIDYYEQVRARNPRPDDFVRLYMEPGVLHCGGGSGPSSVNWLTVISDWVEKNKPPQAVVASLEDKSRRSTSRPLCPYPSRAVYLGRGSADEAANFACREKSGAAALNP